MGFKEKGNIYAQKDDKEGFCSRKIENCRLIEFSFK